MEAKGEDSFGREECKKDIMNIVLSMRRSGISNYLAKEIIANLLLQLVWEFLEETALSDLICDDEFLLEEAQIETQMCADERCGY